MTACISKSPETYIFIISNVYIDERPITKQEWKRNS